jgi:O-succinylbenzoic acid--CoA ligase
MEGALTYLQQRVGDDWLIGHDSGKFNQLSEQLFLQLTQQTHRETRLKILIAESDPVRFLASFIAACAANCHIFLCNPNWVEQEWQQVFNLVQPDLILGQKPQVKFSITHSQLPFNHYPFPSTNRIMIPTGGSSGKIRFVIHTWETLMASVRGFSQYFEQKNINSFCVLPLYHVSGLMQFMRSFTTGGSMVILPFKDMVAGAGKNIDLKSFFISLVPTQLAKLLNYDWAEYLSKFQTVLLGGAPAWEELLEQARLYKIPLAPTYGMTETASQVVTLKPDAFLAGNNSCGQILPHAQVTIRSFSGEILGANQTGIVTIQADSLALGYYLLGESLNLPTTIANFQTDDLGFFDDQGYLNIVGRSSNKIITGGENVFPAEVEAAIQATQLVTDVCVTGLPDSHWGQIVTAVYVARSQAVSPTILQKAIEDKLTKYKRPKHWVPLESLPRNLQGKVNYEEIRKAALAYRNVV